MDTVKRWCDGANPTDNIADRHRSARGVLGNGLTKAAAISSRQVATPGTVMMNGLSERLLVSYHEHNYGGAPRRLNAVRARLAALNRSHTPPRQTSTASGAKS